MTGWMCTGVFADDLEACEAVFELRGCRRCACVVSGGSWVAADTLVRGRVRRLQSVLDSCLECSHTPSLLLFLPGTALVVNAALLLPTVLPAHSCR